MPWRFAKEDENLIRMIVFPRRFWLIIGLFLLLVAQPIYAGGFTVRHIRVEGNQRVSSAAVLSYVPVHVGQTFHLNESVGIIRSLYKSDYFSRIKLLRRDNTLIIRVQELPIISKLTVTGNKAITSKRLRPGLKKLKLQVGDVYHADKLNELKLGLKQAYRNLGRYGVAIDTQIIKKPYNTVAINIKIKEGAIAIVHHIRILGNHAFSEHRLIEQFKLTTPGLFTLLTHSDRYSPLQLDKDLARLHNFYYNHGYLNFKVLSKKVDISPNDKSVSVTVRIYEGSVYRISGYKITGKYADDPKIRHFITIKIGEIFSRKKVLAIDDHISKYFSDEGYAFPKIKAIPKLNTNQRTVFLTFAIQPGQRVYVRQIHVAGNQRTEDRVLRAQMRQLEGSIYSLSKIKESKRRLANLPYFKDIKVTPIPVPGKPDLVDLNYHVTEVNAGRASVQGGYSDVDGLLYGANIS